MAKTRQKAISHEADDVVPLMSSLSWFIEVAGQWEKSERRRLKVLACGQPWAAHVVRTCNTRGTHVIIHVPAVIKTWADVVRRESLGVCHGQSTVIERVLHVGNTGNSVCLVAYRWQMNFSIGWTWLAVLRQCFSSGTASNGHTPYKARPSQNLPKITTYDQVHQIFITSRTWFRCGVLWDWGFREQNIINQPIRFPIGYLYIKALACVVGGSITKHHDWVIACLQDGWTSNMMDI